MKKISGLKKSIVLLAFIGILFCGLAGTEISAGNNAFKVAYVSVAPFEDGGWGSNCYKGFKDSTAKFKNIKTFMIENVATGNIVSTIKKYCDAGVKLVISPDTNVSDAYAQLSKQYPKINFAAIDGSYVSRNVMSMSQNNAEIGFVAGVIAALQTKTKSIGFVGGEESAEIIKASKTMEAGAKYINKDIRYISVMSGSWTDVAKGKEIGLSMINAKNADVIFSFASGVDSGVRQACESSKNVYFIAQPSEALNVSPKITITSIIQSNEMLIYAAMKAADDGTFKGGYVIKGFESGGSCSVGNYNSIFSSKDRAIVSDVIKKITSGKIDCKSYTK
jgi:basic membrane protein A and related proteins